MALVGLLFNLLTISLLKGNYGASLISRKPLTADTVTVIPAHLVTFSEATVSLSLFLSCLSSLNQYLVIWKAFEMHREQVFSSTERTVIRNFTIKKEHKIEVRSVRSQLVSQNSNKIYKALAKLVEETGLISCAETSHCTKPERKRALASKFEVH